MKPYIAYLGGRARLEPGPGAVDAGRGKAVPRTCAPPVPRVPSPRPPAVRSRVPAASALLAVPAPLRPRPAPPSPHSSGQTRPPQPELQEPPPRTRARPLAAALPRGLHRPPCRTRPDRGSPPAAAAAPRPRAPCGPWLCPGAERTGRGARRTAARSGNRTLGTGEGRGLNGLGEALWWVSL